MTLNHWKSNWFPISSIPFLRRNRLEPNEKELVRNHFSSKIDAGRFLRFLWRLVIHRFVSSVSRHISNSRTCQNRANMHHLNRFNHHRRWKSFSLSNRLEMIAATWVMGISFNIEIIQIYFSRKNYGNSFHRHCFCKSVWLGTTQVENQMIRSWRILQARSYTRLSARSYDKIVHIRT